VWTLSLPGFDQILPDFQSGGFLVLTSPSVPLPAPQPPNEGSGGTLTRLGHIDHLFGDDSTYTLIGGADTITDFMHAVDGERLSPAATELDQPD
jgi:hypothetical protein